jgi:DNA-binding Lrp family transcriptional regulator/YHS domain-containing protein
MVDKRVRLDKTDLRILRTLQEDGRATLGDIADRADVSVPTVRSRIKRMEEAGVIERFTIQVNREMVGRGVPVYLTVKTANTKDLAEELSTWPEVVEVSTTSGVSNVICKAYVEDMEGFRSMMKRLDAIDAEVNSHVVIQSFKEDSFTVQPDMVLGITCDTCGKEIESNAIPYTRHNREYYFCCQTCLKDFKTKMEAVA